MRTRARSTASRATCAGEVAGVGAGTRYRYRLDGDRVFPDPISRFQPEGVHGPSEVVDPVAFRWSDGEWRGMPLSEMVIYELHVGTFTPAGTFAAAIERQLACPPDPDSQRAAARRFDPDRIAGKFLAALGLSDADMAQNQPLTPATKLAKDILSPSARA